MLKRHLRFLASLPGLGSRGARRRQRRCAPVVAPLEDRTSLSVAGSAQIASLVNHQAVQASRSIVRFPGGFVKTNPGGTRVKFPGGFVIANPGGARVRFPGGFVIANPGGTTVKFPGGFFNFG